MPRVLRMLCCSFLLVLLAPLVPVPAHAAEPTPEPAPAPVATTLSVSATAVRSGHSSQVTGLLATTAGAPVPGAQVLVQRWGPQGWQDVQAPLTDAAGRFTAAVVAHRDPARNRLRVAYAGDTAHLPVAVEQTVRLVHWGSRVVLRAPRRVVDERRATLRVRWLAGDGAPVRGKVSVQRRAKRPPGGWSRWRTVRRVTTGPEGRATVRVRPRVTTRWRVVAPTLAWVSGARSDVRRVRNVPPGRPVVLPGPRPRVTVPVQRRAVGKGANVVVTPIPDGVWRSMVGRSWRPGCPVGRDGLRLVRTNYWGFDGYRHRGELVVAAGATGNFVGVLNAFHRARVPMRSMYRVDRFGYSPRLNGGDDHRSMAADNTSVFNCRWVVNNPGVRSPHSYGRSFDINPWENPYRSRTGLVPNAWWAGRSHPRVAWRSGSHPVVRILAAHGFRWTYGHGDLHHFDAVGSHRRLATLLESAPCREVACG